MANLKSSLKDIRRTRRRAVRNLAAKIQMKRAVKAATTLQTFSQAQSVLDKLAERGMIHWKKAARKKSRLIKRIQKQALAAPLAPAAVSA